MGVRFTPTNCQLATVIVAATRPRRCCVTPLLRGIGCVRESEDGGFCFPKDVGHVLPQKCPFSRENHDSRLTLCFWGYMSLPSRPHLDRSICSCAAHPWTQQTQTDHATRDINSNRPRLQSACDADQQVKRPTRCCHAPSTEFFSSSSNKTCFSAPNPSFYKASARPFIVHKESTRNGDGMSRHKQNHMLSTE